VVALDNLPADRQSTAMIKVGDRVFTAAEIDRLHHRDGRHPSTAAWGQELTWLSSRFRYRRFAILQQQDRSLHLVREVWDS
jgi:hypothetical protein